MVDSTEAINFSSVTIGQDSGNIFYDSAGTNISLNDREVFAEGRLKSAKRNALVFRIAFNNFCGFSMPSGSVGLGFADVLGETCLVANVEEFVGKPEVREYEWSMRDYLVSQSIESIMRRIDADFDTTW